MAECLNCKKPYIANDEDAGTYKEHFCDESCEQAFNNELEEAMTQQQIRQPAIPDTNAIDVFLNGLPTDMLEDMLEEIEHPTPGEDPGDPEVRERLGARISIVLCDRREQDQDE